MAEHTRQDVRNLAIIAHVDHGKTTLVDALLWQSEMLRESGDDERRLMDLLPADREKSVSVMPKQASVLYHDVRVNILDTPSHPNFGSLADRILCMVDGFVLVVDSCEGPPPQIRFVLRRALEGGLSPIVVMTKLDRPESRPVAVLDEVRDLFVDLDAGESQHAFPVLYCDALRGFCRHEPDGPDRSMVPLLEEILRAVPPPAGDPDGVLQLLVADLDYDDYLGRLAIGRVSSGTIRSGSTVAHCRHDGDTTTGPVSGLYGVEGLRRAERSEARPGDVVSVTGIEAVSIGDTLSAPDRPLPLPPVRADEPTLAVLVTVNDSPMAGLDGRHVTLASLRERLWKEILTNVSIRIEDGDAPESIRILGRGELQLVILIEMMRREGYEMLLSRPSIVTREIDGAKHEPVEALIVDCPEEFSAVVNQKVTDRGGRLTKMVNHGLGRVRSEFRIPSRGLLGFRTEFLSDTRGTGIMSHLLDAFEPSQGEPASRSTGALLADRPGRATAYSIEHLQSRGSMFIAPGDEVFEGMIVGENLRANDVEVNVTKERRPARLQPAPIGEAVRLIPPRSLSLEQALEFIRDDEVVEVTPRALRLRRKVLQRRKS